MSTPLAPATPDEYSAWFIQGIGAEVRWHSAYSSGVATLGMSVSDPPTQSEVRTICRQER